MQRFKHFESLILLLLAVVAATKEAEVKQGKNEKRGLPISLQNHSPNPLLLSASSGPTRPAVRPVSVTVHRSYPVAVPQPYPVQVPKPYPVRFDVPRPYPVAVPQPVPVAVPVPQPVPFVVREQFGVPIAVPKPYPVPVPHPVPVPSSLLLGTGPSYPVAEYPRPYLPFTSLGGASLGAGQPAAYPSLTDTASLYPQIGAGYVRHYSSLGASSLAAAHPTSLQSLGAVEQHPQVPAEYPRGYLSLTNLAGGALTPEKSPQDNAEIPPSPSAPAPASAPSGEDAKDSPPPPPPPSLSPPPVPPTDTPAQPNLPPSTFHFTPNFKL